MSDIINTPNGSNNNAAAWIVGIAAIVVIALIFLFVVPGMRQDATDQNAANENAPAVVDNTPSSNGAGGSPAPAPIINNTTINATSTTINSTTTTR
jgi:hypothetical protein